jgi:hypothetical protein
VCPQLPSLIRSGEEADFIDGLLNRILTRQEWNIKTDTAIICESALVAEEWL